VLDCKQDTILESIAMKRVLEGLIHNMNTPLNLVLGYAQQIRRQHPEITSAETILTAGLNIDDILHACLRQLDLRNSDGTRNILLNDWLPDEIKLLKNVLEIKRNVNLEVTAPSTCVNITMHPLLLSVIIEIIVMAVVRQKPADAENYSLELTLVSDPNLAEIHVSLPVEMVKLGLEPLDLWNKINKCFELDVREIVPVHIEAAGEKYLMLKFPLTESL
jgi:hypothetical protein